MTSLDFDQAQALAGLMRDRDAQRTTIVDTAGRVVLVTLFDEADQIMGTGSITADGRVREHARA